MNQEFNSQVPGDGLHLALHIEEVDGAAGHLDSSTPSSSVTRETSWETAREAPMGELRYIDLNLQTYKTFVSPVLILGAPITQILHFHLP